MSFVQRGRRRMGDLTDFVESGAFTNPDGSGTYDGAPYDPFDPFNPWNMNMGGDAPPSRIPLQTTGIGPSPLAHTDPAPLTYYTPYAPPPGTQSPAIVASGLPVATPAGGITSFISSISSLFGPKASPVTLSPSGAALAVRPTPASSIGGISTSTLLLLAGLGVGAVVLSRRRGA